MTIRCLFCLLAALTLFPSGATAAPMEIPLGQRQLFWDDEGIAQRENLARTMHCPEKRGAVVVPDRPWEMWIQTRCAPVWNAEQQLYQLWLLVCSPDPRYAGPAYAVSRDGIHWTKPSLGQQEYQGSKENNFLALDPPLSWPASNLESVVYTPHDPDPNRRYKALVGAEYRLPAFSPDGIHWKWLDAPKLSSSDEGNLSYDPLTQTYIATLKTFGQYGRAHAIWTSKDFIAWTRLSTTFQSDAEDQERAKEVIRARLGNPALQQPIYNNPADYNADIYNLGLFRYEGFYVGLPAVYYSTGKVGNNTDGFHWIQLAASRDLKTWQRLGDRQAFIGPSPVGEGAYDLMQLLPPSAPIVRDDELWFYYTGLKYRDAPKDADPKQGAVCLAVLRRDGFVSLDATDAPGVLVTKPFVAAGTKLCVNVDAAGGSLDVEILDEQQKPLAIAETVVGDQRRAEVTWRSGDLASLQGKPIQLRFTLRNVRFYSFWLDE